MATPPWVDHKAIDAIYEESANLSAQTGIKHNVDHIWPLKGKGFRGLHVPWNLRVITAAENNRKNNKTPHSEYQI